MENSNDSSGVALMAGIGIAAGIAVIHNASKNEQHKQDLTQMYLDGYWQAKSEDNILLADKDIELGKRDTVIAEKDALLAEKDVLISRLLATNESLRQHGNSGQQKDT